MLNDIPYEKIIDSGRKYEVWVLRDIYDNTFTDIAREYGVSLVCVISDYNKILSLKLNYYMNHLSIVHGYKNTVYFRNICSNADDCYRDRKCVVAYFEKEYATILNKYRNGAPGMPERVLRELPPLRNEFTERTISSIIRLRETDRMTYAAIGKRLRMTKSKAEDLYNRHYHVLYYQLSEKLMEITGDMDLRYKYRKAFRVGSGKKKYDSLVSDYPELCKAIMKTKK